LSIAFGCAAFAAWLSAAMSPVRPLPLDVPHAQDNAAATSGAVLGAEIARLHERLRPNSVPRGETRDLFAFRAQARAASPAPLPVVPPSVPLPPAPPGFALVLVGLAEDPAGAEGDSMPVGRTAIVTGHGQVFLVKEGDTIVDRDATYAVGPIAADGVSVTDRRDDSVHRLTLH
jgi:hypothetical protein